MPALGELAPRAVEHARRVSTFRDRPGIRVVRAIERGEHLEALLVRLDGDPPRALVLARALDETGERLRRRELAALARGAGVGVPEVVDVIDDVRGPGVLLSRVAGRRLGELLAEREEWSAGEAVGVLGPLVATLARLHDAGVAHAALGACEVIVTADGPVITGFLRAELFAAGAPEVVRERVAGVVHDRAVIRELAAVLLARVRGSRSVAAHELAATVATVPGHELLPRLGEGLAELAAPVLVRAVAPRDTAVSRPVGGERIVAVVVDAGEQEAPHARERLSPRVREVLARVRERLDALPALRRRLVVGGGAAIAVAALLLTLIPSRAHEGDGVVAHTVDTSPTPSTPPTLGRTDAAPPRDAVVAAILGDDPVAAAIALLERRETCIAHLSIVCLDEVDQAASAALHDDRHGIEVMRAGGEASLPSEAPEEPRLLERLGDSALVGLGPETAPASLLIVRSEAGWRIRDWVAVD